MLVVGPSSPTPAFSCFSFLYFLLDDSSYSMTSIVNSYFVLLQLQEEAGPFGILETLKTHPVTLKIALISLFYIDYS